MAIDFEFDGKSLPPGARTTRRHSVTGGVDLTGSMEFHASDTPDIALGGTTEVAHARVPDIERVATSEVDARAGGPTPSQLLGEGEHGREATAVVDWASHSMPDFDPGAPPRATVAPVVRARPAPTVPSPAPTVSSRPATRANPTVQTSRVAPPAPARTAALPQAPAANAAASDGVSDLQMLAGQVSVLTELVVAMLAAMPQRESVAGLAARETRR